jgi:hypothetical protein
VKEKMIMFILSVVVLIGLVAGLLIPEPMVMKTVQAERKANYAFMGESAAIAEARAERWYKALFVKTHLTQFTFDIAGGIKAGKARDDSKIERASSTAVEWWKGRMRVLWSVAFQFLVRLSNNLIWLPLGLLVLLPFIVDAMVVRKIKTTNFALASPHMQLFGTKSMILIVVGYLVLQLLPMKLHPVTAPLALALFSISTWIGISQFAKRA